MSFVDEVTVGAVVLAALGLALDWFDRRGDRRRKAQESAPPPAE